MWTDSIQMLFAVTANRKRVALMQSRRETLSREDSTAANSERMFLGLAVHGLRYAYQALEKSFLKLARGWLQGHFCAPLPLSDVTPTGNIDPSPCRTQRLTDYRLIQTRTQSLMLGYHTIWRDINLVSQCCSAPPGLLVLCLGMIYDGLRLVARSLRRADASMFTELTSCSRKTTIISHIRADSFRQNIMGPCTRQTRLFWRTL